MKKLPRKYVIEWLQREIDHFENEAMEAKLEAESCLDALVKFKKRGSLSRLLRYRFNQRPF